jgi:hypothetical protein
MRNLLKLKKSHLQQNDNLRHLQQQQPQQQPHHRNKNRQNQFIIKQSLIHTRQTITTFFVCCVEKNRKRLKRHKADRKQPISRQCRRHAKWYD